MIKTTTEQGLLLRGYSFPTRLCLIVDKNGFVQESASACNDSRVCGLFGRRRAGFFSRNLIGILCYQGRMYLLLNNRLYPVREQNISTTVSAKGFFTKKFAVWAGEDLIHEHFFFMMGSKRSDPLDNPIEYEICHWVSDSTLESSFVDLWGS